MTKGYCKNGKISKRVFFLQIGYFPIEGYSIQLGSIIWYLFKDVQNLDFKPEISTHSIGRFSGDVIIILCFWRKKSFGL